MKFNFRNKYYRFLFTMTLTLIWSFSTMGQLVESDTTETKPIVVINADKTQGFDKGAKSILTGNVILRQDSTVIYAHNVNLFSETNSAQAFGNVIIQRTDSTNAYCNELEYYGNTEYASMVGDVVLENGAQKLYADELEYDIKNNVAYYSKKSLMTDGDRLISSKSGRYYVDSALVVFYDSVVVAGPDYTMRTDSLHFNTVTKTAYFVAPVRMKQGENNIYNEAGYYDLVTNVAELRQNAQFSSPTQEATADTILFYGQNEDFILIGNTWVKEKDRVVTADRIEYKKSLDKAILIGNVDYQDENQSAVGERMEYILSTGAFQSEGRAEIVQGSQTLKADRTKQLEDGVTTRASGNVIWIDEEQDVSLICEEAIINEESKTVKAYGENLTLITQMEGDSLFMTADTLFTTRAFDADSQEIRNIFAYFNVVGYKNNLQFVADSMSFNEQDSLFRIFGDPVIWSDTTRFFGDTIDVQMANELIDEIFIKDNAFVVNKNFTDLYNQVKGREITAKFLDGELSSTYVKGNAESIYYAEDEAGSFIGVNKIECSEMKLQFTNNQVGEIRFYKIPTSVFHPMQQIDHNSLRLEGFSTDETYRGTSPEDIFRVYALKKKATAKFN